MEAWSLPISNGGEKSQPEPEFPKQEDRGNVLKIVVSLHGIKMQLRKIKRMEELLKGHLVEAKVEEDWFEFPKAFKLLCGGPDKAQQLETLEKLFIEKQIFDVIKMLENENKLIDVMLELQRFPSDGVFTLVAEKLQNLREKLMETVRQQLELIK